MTNSLARALADAVTKHGDRLTAKQKEALQGAVEAAESIDDDEDEADPFTNPVPADVVAAGQLFD